MGGGRLRQFKVLVVSVKFPLGERSEKEAGYSSIITAEFTGCTYEAHCGQRQDAVDVLHSVWQALKGYTGWMGWDGQGHGGVSPREGRNASLACPAQDKGLFFRQSLF